MYAYIYERGLPADILMRDDTRAHHIRTCFEIGRESGNNACATSGWGGPGEQAFDKLREVFYLMAAEVEIQLIEDRLIDRGYYEWSVKEDPLFEGNWQRTYDSRTGELNGITINPFTGSAHIGERETMRLWLADEILEGYDGTREDWENGYCGFGYVSVI